MMTLNSVRTQWKAFITARPLLKSCLTYAVLWPTSNVIHQSLEGKNFKTFDYIKILRFGIFGTLYSAPVFYGWGRLTTAMWPQMTWRIGLIKSAIEQVSYNPFSCASFFVGMSLLEFKTMHEAVEELKLKFLPTWKVGLVVWPILRMINFAVIPEKKRLLFASFCSLMWATFLAEMKMRDMQNPIPSKEFEDKK